MGATPHYSFAVARAHRERSKAFLGRTTLRATDPLGKRFLERRNCGRDDMHLSRQKVGGGLSFNTGFRPDSDDLLGKGMKTQLEVGDERSAFHQGSPVPVSSAFPHQSRIVDEVCGPSVGVARERSARSYLAWTMRS